MPATRHLTTEEKALKINLQSDIYGCFAEIGAGQEVAANFFKAWREILSASCVLPSDLSPLAF